MVLMDASAASQFAEIQGLYGAVTFSERLVQRIWLRGDFCQKDLQTHSGKRLAIHHPGRWNLQEGPDFLGAEFSLGGRRLRGDVEIHFYEQDWRQHGHDRQSRFDDVILHVVVFPPQDKADIRTSSGRRPEAFCLLPCLDEDLEAYASEEAMRHWAQVHGSLMLGELTVPAGTYTLWSTFTPESAHLVVNRQTDQWGTQYDPEQDLGRVEMTRTPLDAPVERFTISVEDGELRLAWDRTRFSVPITVPSGQRP